MIKFKNITKYFDDIKALDDVSFDIKKWEICGFIWENGAGKSTLMKLLATLILDYKWDVEVDGKNLKENIYDIRKIIWFMPDQYWFYDDLTVFEYLNFFSLAYWLKNNEKNIIKTLEEVFLLEKKDSPIKWLSRGMSQRICLAKALIWW